MTTVPDPADAVAINPITTPGWRARIASKLFGASADDENEYPFERSVLEEKLKTDDPDLAAEILSEARELHDVMVAGRVDTVERRAAALQGVVAVAATFVLAGGTLIIAQVDGRLWRASAGVVLLVCVAFLGMCGWLATQASSQYRRWVIHPRQAVFDRPNQTIAQARVAQAASFLYITGKNSRHARWKVTKLRKAVDYLRLALAGLVVFAVLILAYAVAGPTSASPTTKDVSGAIHGHGYSRRP
jgi:hypothetical protein